MYIVVAFIHNIIQRSRERLKRLETKILNLFKPFDPLWNLSFLV